MSLDLFTCCIHVLNRWSNLLVDVVDVIEVERNVEIVLLVLVVELIDLIVAYLYLCSVVAVRISCYLN